MRQKQPRIHNEKHLAFVRGLPCLVCKTNLTIDPAHIRYADLERGKRAVGIGEKPDDRWVVPLCRKHHDEQHGMNERRFWDSYCLDPIFYAKHLYDVTGDHEAGMEIVETAGIGEVLNMLAAG